MHGMEKGGSIMLTVTCLAMFVKPADKSDAGSWQFALPKGMIFGLYTVDHNPNRPRIFPGFGISAR